MLQQARRHIIERVGELSDDWKEKKPMPEKFKAVLALGRNVSFYLGGDVASVEANVNCETSRYMAHAAHLPMGTDEGQLAQLSGVLWDNNEYALENYFVSRLLCGDLVRVYDASAADLCYPSCGGPVQEAERENIRQQLRDDVGPKKNLGGFEIEDLGLIFRVPHHSRKKWHNCENIGLFYEVEDRKDDDRLGMGHECKIMVPYLHGVAQLSEDDRMPYDKWLSKPTLLSFVGGSTYSRSRGRLLHEMVNYSTRMPSDDLFGMPFDLPHNEGKFWHTPEMYKLVWEQYASSQFSWQPFGDTATRRGFYDAWMFSSIPVVTYASSRYYRNLFRRALVPHIRSAALLLPDEVLVDGPTVIQYVANISGLERQSRRAVMGSVAPMMQWGWKAEGDALIMALGLLQA